MAKKCRSCQTVTEVEKSREESNLKNVIDLSEKLKLRSYFLIGEGKLELCLEELPLAATNISKARTGLTEAKDIC
jgi:hypothetical protein